MKSIKYIVAAAVLAGLATASYATVTVDYGSAASTFFSDQGGNYEATTFELGTFATAPTQGSSSLAGFSSFGSDTISDGAISGGFTGTAGATFGHDQIYLVAFGPGTQIFIGDVSDTVDSAWKFPADADVVTATAIDLGDFASGGGGTTTLASGANVVFGKVAVDPSGPYTLLETFAVPEPSSIALVVLGLVGSIGMIRRRRS